MKNFTLDFERPIRELELKIDELENLGQDGGIGIEGEIKKLRRKADKLRKDIYSNLTRWQQVQLARHPMRPYAMDYISRIFTDFVELHGDRLFSDDKAIVSGLGRLNGNRVAIVAQQKGRETKEKIRRNFGSAHPEGYRKALRIMHLAEKFNLPIITFIDTPGAYPGIGAEERGQASAIAVNLYEMAKLRVPIIAIVIGEGGSGGALALGVADKVYMLEFAVYSVISPEGCASILFRDSSEAQRAAEALKITSADLYKLNVIDGVIKEPLGGAHYDMESTVKEISKTLTEALMKLMKIEPEKRIQLRIDKFGKMGEFQE